MLASCPGPKSVLICSLPPLTVAMPIERVCVCWFVCVIVEVLYTPFVLMGFMFWPSLPEPVSAPMFFMSNLKTFSPSTFCALCAVPVFSAYQRSPFLLPPLLYFWTLPHSSCCCCSGHTWSLLQDIQLGRLAAASSCSLLLAVVLVVVLGNCFVCILWSFLMCSRVCVLWCAHKYLVLINFYKYSLWHF